MSNESGVALLVTGVLAFLGLFILPFIASIAFWDMNTPTPHQRNILIALMVFMALPFVWRVWVLAVTVN